MVYRDCGQRMARIISDRNDVGKGAVKNKFVITVWRTLMKTSGTEVKKGFLTVQNLRSARS